MEDFFKYITASQEDKEWGIYFNTAGKSKVDPNSPYPIPKHPTGYFFNYENGRILKEYQIIYFTEGEGILENKHGKFQIKPGTVMMTFPDCWHRYRPLKKTGWTENYIGFSGDITKSFINKTNFTPESPIIYYGLKEEIIDSYYKIFTLIQKEKPGYQQIVSGLIIKLLGYLISFQKQKGFTGKSIEKVIEDTMFAIRENIDKNIELEKLAQNHNIGYSYFRKMFKKYTGMSPGNYHLELKIFRAKELLLISDKRIKEISLELGFQSIYYFSRFFKNKAGVSPSEFRNTGIF